MHKYKILGIIASHTNSTLKYNININNISILKEYLTEICLIDTITERYAILLKSDLTIANNLIKNYYLIDNNHLYDYGKWIYGLHNINYNDFDYVLFINDSILLTPNISKYFEYINNYMLDNINLFAYNDTNEIKHHYPNYLFLLKTTIISKFIDFIDNKKSLINDLKTLMTNLDLCIKDIDENHECFIKIDGNEELMQKYLLVKNIFGIIKLKKLTNCQDNYKINIYGKSFKDFDHYFYRNFYDDLNKMTTDELLEHYITIGQFEGRRFKNNMFNVLPEYYRNILKNLNMLYFFDLPDDFDIYNYKIYNPDISKFTDINVINHYIKNGIYEGRTYYKNKFTKDNDINEFYKNCINKLAIIKKPVNLPNLFNVYSHILFNSQYDQYFIVGSIINYNVSKNVIQLYRRSDFEKNMKDFNIDLYRRDNNIRKYDDIHTIQHYLYKKFNNNLLLKLPEDFDLEFYKQINPDLKNISNDKIIEHYVQFGATENRIYKLPNDFNYTIYQKIYKDLKNMNKNELEKHYLMIGAKEHRIYNVPNNFSIDKYKKIYQNINNLNLKEINELRNKNVNEVIPIGIPNDFNPILYSKIYPELNQLTTKELENHYLHYGIHEGRIYKIPDDFNPLLYKTIYKELEELTDEELKEHYLYKGISKGYIYKIPDDFNPKIYRRIYKDLFNLSDIKLVEHYLLHGIKEKRIYKIPYDFNPIEYKNINRDLINLTDSQLIEHYLYTGLSNGKIYKIPDDFDPSIYKLIYKDVANLSDEQLCNHYLYSGFQEGRIYKITTLDNFENFTNTFKNTNDINYDGVYKLIIFNNNNNIYMNNLNINSNISNTNIPNTNISNTNINYNNINTNILDNNIDNDNDISKSNIKNKNNKNKLKNNKYTKYNKNKIKNIDISDISNDIYSDLPLDFNPNMYKKFNSDLNKLSDDLLKKHYIEYGIKENRLYKIPDDFEPNEYKKLNKDLHNLNSTQLIEHYIMNGSKENRIYKIPNDFKLENYRKSNPDLNFLSNQKLYEHFITSGYKDGRKYYDTTILDESKPNIINNLNNLNKNITDKFIDSNLNSNYINNNINSNLIENNSNNNNYNNNNNINNNNNNNYNNNSKLINGFTKNNNNKLLNGFTNSNNINNLNSSIDINILNKLQNIDIYENIKHKNMIKIQTPLLFDFNANYYKTIYPELNELTEEQLKSHYMKKGIHENRYYKIPTDFNPVIYKNMYPDLSNLSDNDAYDHFINHGMKERRKYK